MEHVEPDGYEMGLADHRRSPEPKIKHWLAILQTFDRGDCVSDWRRLRAGWTACHLCGAVGGSKGVGIV
jgi:hypothetical protein